MLGHPRKYREGDVASGGRAMFGPLLLSFLLLAVMARPLMASGDPKPGTILVPVLKIRSGPGRHHPPIAALKRGDRVLVLSYEGEWVRILFKGQTGFIMNRERYLQIDEPAGEPAAPGESDGDIKRKLAVSQKKVASFSKEETTIINALEDTEKSLSRERKKVARLSKDLAAMERRHGELERRYHRLEKHAQTTEGYVAGRLAALYKLSWLGRFHVLASADSMFDFFSRKRAMEQILLHDQTVMAQLTRDKTEMQALLDQLEAGKKEKQAMAADLNAKIGAMDAEQATREALLAEIRSKKSLQLAAIDSLKASARELDRTVEALGTAPNSGASLQTKMTEKPFAALKGLLMMPVKGKIVSFFGQKKDRKLKITNFQSGITIKADRGEPIRAVYSGKTLFSSWFRGFGNMMIVDHGDHYYTVYAHLEEQFKSKGDPVETGEVIATVGDTGSFTGAGLHFEIRYHGKPVNPLKWIKKS
jgi:septal ring factor EnvC (AmiA/AmiB activator)